jgi:hypothetical protein
MAKCTRCLVQEGIYEHKWKDEEGYEKKYLLCRDCDFDVMNGGDWDEDPSDIAIDREEQEYFDDPINNPMPSWMRG